MAAAAAAPPPGAAAARVMDALRGGPHGRLRERQAAAEIERRWPGTGEQLRRAAGLHSLLAQWAVSGLRSPAARSVIFANAGYPPSGWPGAALPHLAAARSAPSARFAYAVADEALALLWRRTLSGDPRAVARQASAGDAAQLAGMARGSGLEGPWQVQLQLIAHWWTGPEAAAVVAGWAAELPPGSSLVLTVPVPGGVPAGGRMGALMGQAAGIAPSAHSPAGIAGWVTAAGLALHWGPADVRAWPVSAVGADAGLAAGIAGRVAGVVALRA